MALEVGNPKAFDSSVMMAAFPQIMDTNIANTLGAFTTFIHSYINTLYYMLVCMATYLSDDEVGVYAEAHCDEKEAQ